MNTPEVQLASPGALIAAVPAVLGFVPERSLVLICVEDGDVGAVLRTDVSTPLGDQAAALAAACAAGGAAGVVALVVDEDSDGCQACVTEYEDVVADLSAELAGVDLVLLAALLVPRITAGAPWRALGRDTAPSTRRVGLVEDPSSSPAAAAAVLDGRRLYPRRADVTALFAVGDPARAAEVAAQVGVLARAAEPAGATEAACALAQVLRAVTRPPGAGEPDDGAVAGLVWQMSDRRVRDALFGVSLGPYAGAAELLWVQLATRVASPWRIEPLVQLAFFAYVRGDGPLAGIALQAALAVDPDHSLAGMLEQALRSGLRPHHIRELAATGRRLASELGVPLPGRAGG